MDHLNYHRLRVFWTTAREGGVTRASEKLPVSQPTVTSQIRAPERVLGQRFHAITVERKVKHPAVVAICQAARRRLFQ